MINGAFVVCLVLCIGFGVAAVKAIIHDANLAALEALDDEEFAAVMTEHPDAILGLSRW